MMSPNNDPLPKVIPPPLHSLTHLDTKAWKTGWGTTGGTNRREFSEVTPWGGIYWILDLPPGAKPGDYSQAEPRLEVLVLQPGAGSIDPSVIRRALRVGWLHRLPTAPKVIGAGVAGGSGTGYLVEGLAADPSTAAVVSIGVGGAVLIAGGIGWLERWTQRAANSLVRVPSSSEVPERLNGGVETVLLVSSRISEFQADNKGRSDAADLTNVANQLQEAIREGLWNRVHADLHDEAIVHWGDQVRDLVELLFQLGVDFGWSTALEALPTVTRVVGAGPLSSINDEPVRVMQEIYNETLQLALAEEQTQRHAELPLQQERDLERQRREDIARGERAAGVELGEAHLAELRQRRQARLDALHELHDDVGDEV